MTREQEIRNIPLDTIEGWYTANASRMDRALSPHLAKRRTVSENEMWHVDKAWMVQATADGNGKIEEPLAGKKDVTILDQTATMASVKTVSDRFIDYLHLSSASGRWKIVNALWDYRSE